LNPEIKRETEKLKVRLEDYRRSIEDFCGNIEKLIQILQEEDVENALKVIAEVLRALGNLKHEESHLIESLSDILPKILRKR